MRLHVLAALGLCLGRGAEVVVGGHDHEGEHALRDDVHDGVRNHLSNRQAVSGENTRREIRQVSRPKTGETRGHRKNHMSADK